LKQELDKERANAVTQLEEWTQKLVDAQTGSSVAVDEVTKQLTDKLDKQVEAHQQAMEENENKLKEVLREMETLKKDMLECQSASEEVSIALTKEKELLQAAQEEVAQLKQELDKERANAVTQLEEWTQKLVDAQTGSSVAVDEVTKQLTDKLDKQVEAHQQAMEENEKAKEALEQEHANIVQEMQRTETSLKEKVESLEVQVSALEAEVTSKAEELVRDKDTHEKALVELEARLVETAKKQTEEQVEAAVSDARTTAQNTLEESLKEQDANIRKQCAESQASALSKQAEEFAAEKKSALDDSAAKHQKACSELSEELKASAAAALAEQQVKLDTAHASAIATLESQRASDQEKAKQEAADALEAHQVEVTAMKAAQAAVQLELDNIAETNRLKTEEAIANFRIESEEKLKQAVAAIRHEMQSLVDTADAAREEYLQLYTKESKARKAIHNKLMEIQGNIRVVCRVRPILDVERKQAKGADVDATEILSEEDIIVHRDASTKNRFEFDRVFPPGGTQSAVFASVQPLIVSVLDGYNVCIFAYGQTGSGKTYTMEGYGDNPEDKGVSPRAIDDLFSFIGDSVENWSYVVKFSMLEIYNETIRDLLVDPITSSGGKAPEPVKLDIRQTSSGNVVTGLTEIEVAQPHEVLDLMNRGQKNRAVGAHDMNEHSSRSHSILTLTVRGVNNKDGSTTCGKLHLIDLAGSERVGKTDATGDRLKEAQNINRSLSALGDVINSLGSKKSSHVPYRNSKLTFLLQDSLGGNSKVLMFVNISPAVYNVNESICSLNFAFRCRNVELGQAKKQIGNGSTSGSGGSGGPSTPSKLSSSSSSSSSLRRSSTATTTAMRK